MDWASATPSICGRVLFPDASKTPGPSLRSGDFGEILVADYIEYLLGYWCPRTLRYQDRWNRNDSTKGCDIIGFGFTSGEPHHCEDELFIFESKSGMTKTNTNRLQDAITDSIKDHLREAMTLNAMKQRMLVRGEQERAEKAPLPGHISNHVSRSPAGVSAATRASGRPADRGIGRLGRRPFLMAYRTMCLGAGARFPVYARGNPGDLRRHRFR